jgi:hypothetical protein
VNINLGELNYLALVVVTVFSCALGVAWYTVWVRPWMKEVGLTREAVLANRAQAVRGYAIAAVSWLLTASTLAVIVQLANATTLVDGLVLGLMVGVGSVATFLAVNYSFAMKSLRLYFIDVGYPVLAHAIMGSILALWR